MQRSFFYIVPVIYSHKKMNNLKYFTQRLKHLFNFHISFFLAVLIISACFNTATMAQGNLLIFPKRVIFEGNQRMQEVNLANTDNDTARYVISFVQIRMKENGDFEYITKPDSGQRFASNFLRYFPRTVVLGPKEAQLLKIQLIHTDQLKPGEYRSHLYFRSIPREKPLALGSKKSVKDSTTVSVQLVPIFGITIPVIIRVGKSTTKANISNASFKMINDSTQAVSFSIDRSGNMSTYGDIKINYISPQDNITQVAFIEGVAVYTPNLMRNCLIKLENTRGIDFHKGKLKITYTAQRDDRNKMLAETELQLK